VDGAVPGRGAGGKAGGGVSYYTVTLPARLSRPQRIALALYKRLLSRWSATRLAKHLPAIHAAVKRRMESTEQ